MDKNDNTCNVSDDYEIEELSCPSHRTDNVTAVKARPVHKRKNQWSQAKQKRDRSLVKKTKPKVFGDYWEIEHVLAVRERIVESSNQKATTKTGGRPNKNSSDKSYSAPTTITEFLIQWKGSFENSWEPEENLCDTALDEAHLLLEKEATRKLGLLDQKKPSKGHLEKRSSPRLKSTNEESADEHDDDINVDDIEGASDSDEIEYEDNHPDQCHEEAVEKSEENTASCNNGLIIEDTSIDWSNSSLTKLPIQRISVHDPECKVQLMMSRSLGVPIVLTCHKGWVQFASRWLSLPTTLVPSVSPVSISFMDATTNSLSPVSNSVMDVATNASSEPQNCSEPTVVDVATNVSSEPQNCSESTVDSAFHHLSSLLKESNDGKTTLKGHTIDSIGDGKAFSCLNETETGDFVSVTDYGTSHVGSDEVSIMGPEPAMLDTHQDIALYHKIRVVEENQDSDSGACGNGHIVEMPPYSTSASDVPVPSSCDVEKVKNDSEPLDLTLPYVIDIDKMVNDIGSEMVPILRKNYKDEQPIKAYMSVRRFLRDYWPSSSSPNIDCGTDCHHDNTGAKKVPLLYLHQWLFTASETAVPKLCNQNFLLPHNVLNEDLLRYWYNQDQCAGDSPYQYLFMGSTETMSRLHKDSGGLDIFIAPIVGEKEVTLVHRSDGPTSLYHLEANIDEPDFQKFPMLYSARVWQAVIKPGEILVMPHGTFHQCRNITPCLSYHRFHLDSLNLHAFYESWRDRDAPDIDHEEVIWNAATELSNKIDMYTEEYRIAQMSSNDCTKLSSNDAPAHVIIAVSTLQCLHKVCLEMSMRADLMNDHNSDWKLLVQDVEETLHDFRFRQSDVIPPLHQKHPRKTSKRRNHKQ